MYPSDWPISRDLIYKTEKAPLGTILLRFSPGRAQPTWRMWYDVVNGMSVFLETYENVGFLYKVRSESGVVIAKGELSILLEFP